MSYTDGIHDLFIIYLFIMGNPLGEVLKTVTSQLYQPYANSYFTNVAKQIIVRSTLKMRYSSTGNTLWFCPLVTQQYMIASKL